MLFPLLPHPERRTNTGIRLKTSPRKARIETIFPTFGAAISHGFASLAWRTDTLYLITLSANCTDTITSEIFPAGRRPPRRILSGSPQLRPETTHPDCSHGSSATLPRAAAAVDRTNSRLPPVCEKLVQAEGNTPSIYGRLHTPMFHEGFL